MYQRQQEVLRKTLDPNTSNLDTFEAAKLGWELMLYWLFEQMSIDGDLVQIEEILNEWLQEAYGQYLKGIWLHVLEESYTAEQIEDYVLEAEHQEGASYWSQFKSAEELLKDVALYYTS